MFFAPSLLSPTPPLLFSHHLSLSLSFLTPLPSSLPFSFPPPPSLLPSFPSYAYLHPTPPLSPLPLPPPPHSLPLLTSFPPGTEGKPSSAKKRRRSTSSGGLALIRVTSPGNPLTFNPAAMTERQQMAYLLQMTDPQKKSGRSPTLVPVQFVILWGKCGEKKLIMNVFQSDFIDLTAFGVCMCSFM